MNKLFMKIHGFEELSNSLLVSFASDTTKSPDPEVYPQYAFQPLNMWPGVSDHIEILKRIAVAGIYHAEQQEREEKFIADSTKVDQYKAMVNSIHEYTLDELIAAPGEFEVTPFIEVL